MVKIRKRDDVYQKMKKSNALERAGAKGELRESNQLLRTLTERSLTGIYVVQDGKIHTINPNAAAYAGYTPQDLIGKEASSIIHPDDVISAKENARKMLSGQKVTPHEFRIITRAGGIRWIMETVTPISFEGRRAVLGNSMDITEYKLAEEALTESKRRFGDLIEFLPDATFAIDLDGKLIAWNRAAEELTGVKAKDILGKKDYEYALPYWKKRRPMSINLVLKTNKQYEQTYTIFTRARNLVIVEVTVPGIQVSGRNAYLWGKASPLYDSKG
ncbi:MAG TPA: PAS domain S-box protein, partial [Syntrophales bacterium]|nr:PAS domain S-box protein [Syntrophales bacterium]